MRTPGRPADATVHPRTRPEAAEIARKHRSENDWFRHDGKNAEPPPPGHVRLAGSYSGDIAAKMKGEPTSWYQHNPKNPTDYRPPSRCRTAESRQCKEKVYGSQEAWYKFDDNANYHTPRPANRMTTVQGKEVYDKMAHRDTMDWYHHEHRDAYTPPRPKTRTGYNHAVEDQGHKLRPSGAPDWYSTNSRPTDLEVVGSRPASRLQTTDATGYQDRNKTGTAKDWFGHDPSRQDAQQPGSPRVLSPEAETIASRLKGESGDWFNHDANKHYTEGRKNVRGDRACQEMVEKSRGGAMERTLQGSGDGEPQRAKERIKPEAQDIAKKSIQGLMDKFLKQDENRGYQSARPAGRVVKPEAQAIAAKNAGVMSDCMGGYAAPAVRPAKPPGRAVKPGEAAEIAGKSRGGQMGRVLGEYGRTPGTPGRHAARVVKPEAAAAAERNKGVMGALMVGGTAVSARPEPRLREGAARENADRAKGTMGGLIAGQA